MEGDNEMKKTLLATALLIASTQVSAEMFLSGQKLKDLCSALDPTAEGVIEDKFSAGLCGGYISGVIDGIRGDLCLPPNSTESTPFRLAVRKYLIDRPEQLRYEAKAVVYIALIEAFPCAEK